MGISTNPDQAVSGGNLPESVKVRVLKSRACMFDYKGQAAGGAIPAIMWEMEPLESDIELEPQYWKAGNSGDFIVGKDGLTFEPDPDSRTKKNYMHKSCNAMMLFSSLVTAGYPKDKMSDVYSDYEGLECQLERVSAYRPGLDSTKDKFTYVVTKIYKLPWEEDKGGGKSKGKSRSKANGNGKAADSDSGADAGADDIQGTCVDTVLQILADKGGSVARAAIVLAANSLLDRALPGRSKILSTIISEEFLSNGPWTYKDGTVSL